MACCSYVVFLIGEICVTLDALTRRYRLRRGGVVPRVATAADWRPQRQPSQLRSA